METITARSRPILGVLGGMGPVATADFLLRLARLTPARRDQDHVPTIVYSDPATPDRSDAILGVGPSPLAAMRRGIDFLNRSGCALIAIPCNSAHYWFEELASESATPVLHIADATAERIESHAGVNTVGIMATDGTIRSGIYHTRLAALGVATVDLSDLGDVSPVMRGIRALKAGDEARARDALLDAGAQLVDRGAKVLVSACTDVSAAIAGVTTIDEMPVLDASDCLARACLIKLGHRSA